MGQSLGPSETFALARHIIDLAALCVGAHRDAEEMAARRGLASARFDAIKADVLNQVADSSIRLAQVADRHHISERYVQQLFELAGTSFSGFVLEQRLVLARKLLRDPSQRWRKISDIATASGFADISYFTAHFDRASARGRAMFAPRTIASWLAAMIALPNESATDERTPVNGPNKLVSRRSLTCSNPRRNPGHRPP